LWLASLIVPFCNTLISNQDKMAQAARIPVIDLSEADRDEKQAAQELVEAAIEHGFIYIRCSDIPAEAIDTAFRVVIHSYHSYGKRVFLTQNDAISQSRELFACALEEKQECTIQQNNRGVSKADSFTHLSHLRVLIGR